MACRRDFRSSAINGRQLTGPGPVGRAKLSALRRKNNGATAIAPSELHLALSSENGAMRFAYCALRTLPDRGFGAMRYAYFPVRVLAFVHQTGTAVLRSK